MADRQKLVVRPWAGKYLRRSNTGNVTTPLWS
jgi:hypothetical protein